MLIPCPDCGKEIDESLVSCPYCNFIFSKEKPSEEEKVQAIEVLLHTRKISLVYTKILKAINILSLILLGIACIFIFYYCFRSENINVLPELYKNAKKTMKAIRTLIIISFLLLFLSRLIGYFEIFFLSPFILKKVNTTKFDARLYYKKCMNDPTITVDFEDYILLNILKYNQYPKKQLPKILTLILVLVCGAIAFVLCYIGFDEILIRIMHFALRIEKDIDLTLNAEFIIGLILLFGSMIAANFTVDDIKSANKYWASLILGRSL